MSLQDLIDMKAEFNRHQMSEGLGLIPTTVELGHLTYEQIRKELKKGAPVQCDKVATIPIMVHGLKVVKVDKPHHLKVY